MGTKDAMELKDASPAKPTTHAPAGGTPRSREAIQKWLTEYLAFLLGEPPAAVDITLSFDSHGIDSAAAVSLVADLEEWLGIELDPTIVYDYPTVAELTAFLVNQQGKGVA